MVVQAIAKRAYQGPYKSKFGQWFFRLMYNYAWEGREYGLQYHDALYEPAPEVQEALRRYRIADPYGYDLRQQRILQSAFLGMNNERLPKEEWTKLEDDTFYLGAILDEIENEKLERVNTSGLKPGYELHPHL